MSCRCFVKRFFKTKKRNGLINLHQNEDMFASCAGDRHDYLAAARPLKVDVDFAQLAWTGRMPQDVIGIRF